VIPLYNEEESVDKLVARILAAASNFDFDYEIILVDDGSTDHTWRNIERLKENTPHLRGIKFRRNFGQTAAMAAGFDHARGDVIVALDGDLQNDPNDIPILLRKMQEGFDIVSGWRKERKDHWSRVLPSKVANWMISRTTGVCLHDYGCSLKAYRAECIKPLKAYGEMHRFLPALATMTGARVAEVPVNHYPRMHGRSKYGFGRIVKVFCDIFSMSLIIRFISRPLTGFVLFALPFLCLSVFFLALSISAVVFQWTAGKELFFIIASGLSGMSLLELVVLGILGELVIGTSDLSVTQMPSLSRKVISIHEITDLQGDCQEGPESISIMNSRAVE
jgi:glycosyltransferase involved in cell wall biosynthesis